MYMYFIVNYITLYIYIYTYIYICLYVYIYTRLSLDPHRVFTLEEKAELQYIPDCKGFHKIF